MFGIQLQIKLVEQNAWPCNAAPPLLRWRRGKGEEARPLAL